MRLWSYCWLIPPVGLPWDSAPEPEMLLNLLEEVVARQPENRARRHVASTLAAFELPLDDPAITRAVAVLAGLLIKM